MVFYESPHRILKTLESLQKFCPNKKVCLAREITKIYEEFKTGSPSELLDYLTKNPIHQKGKEVFVYNEKIVDTWLILIFLQQIFWIYGDFVGRRQRR